jgi:alpha-L-fucosidase
MIKAVCAALFTAVAIGGLSAASVLAGDKPAKLPMCEGPFQPTMESLKQYKCPEWFRDAKFGIWAHWGPQAVPMNGDWYARGMYEQGSSHYKYHVEHYGHPSQFGYKDIIPLWKAEKWDPERLMALYKKAGARYFVSMGSHHDNFHLWNSKHHEWNAVNMGPKRDVVADWQKAAKRQGLRFGVSEHLGASFWWFQTSHGADKTGPKAGVPYDGANPKWQDLYHFPAAPNDTTWYSSNPKWQRQWYDCITDLIDNYDVDLLYTDGGVPFGNEVGRSMIADLYNRNLKTHDGRLEVVYTCKQRSEGRWIEDLERGVMPKINPDPWQTDTSIGDWYYNRNWKFRPVSWTIHMLADIVSKNGNLLLNVVQRPDGSLDAEVEKMLEELAAWNAVNGEAIFGTRPWLVYGEGAVKAKGGHFGEDFAYSCKDIRFTTKGDKTLYAIALGWPTDGKLTIRALAKAGDGSGAIENVSLLGHQGKIDWTQTADGLVVTLPAEKPCDYAVTLKITGADLKPVAVAQAVQPIVPDARGNFTLPADGAELQGKLAIEQQGGQPNIGFWDDAADTASWTVKFPAAGVYKVSGSFAAQSGDSAVIIEAAGQKIDGKIAQTPSWADFKEVQFGALKIDKAGTVLLKARPGENWKAVNLRSIRLTKEAEPAK